MALNEKDIVDEILKYVAPKGGIHSEWYVGTTKDPQKALFKKHNVDKKMIYGCLIMPLSAWMHKEQCLDLL